MDILSQREVGRVSIPARDLFGYSESARRAGLPFLPEICLDILSQREIAGFPFIPEICLDILSQ